MSRYLVEVCLEQVTPVIVEADSEAEALERVRYQQGEPGDPYPVEARTRKIRCLDERGQHGESA